jgi:GT2 family glycosyltransferase
VPWAIGAFLLVRRAAWDAVGGFDPEQWMYAEDLDLGWRLHRAGWATRYEPRAVVDHHEAAATAQAWGEERTERWQRATYAWMLRRRGLARTRAAAAMNVAGAAARWAALAPAARAQPARFAHKRAAQRRWMRAHASGLAPRADLERFR